MINLDERLLAVANLVPTCETIADIGADHGRLSAYLMQSGRVKSAMLCDISDASLNKARALFMRTGLTGEFICADGLSGLSPVDAIIIAGMGARTMIHILQGDLHGATLVLQANIDTECVRAHLVARGYMIVDETLMRCAGRWYVAVKAQPGDEQYTDAELLAGPILLKKGGSNFEQYARHRLMVDTAARKEQQVHIWREILG